MNQTALITGASQRIGRALTLHLAEKGWNVMIHYNASAEKALELARQLQKKFPAQQFETLQGNLSNTEEVKDLLPKALGVFSKINLLVNNASVFDPGYIDETSLELFDQQMDVNLKAPFFLIQCFKNLIGEGNIINFLDTRVTDNYSNFAAYSLSKKALWELTKMAALEFAPEIRVNAIAPGVTLAPADKGQSYLENLAQQIPMKKPGGVEPIIQSLDYILNNKHLTGQLLFADGGENLGQNK